MKSLLTIAALCVALALAVAGCGSSSSDSSTGSTESESTASAESTTATKSKTKPKVTVPKGAPPKKLEIKEIEEGTGAEAKSGNEVTVQYVGVGYDTKKNSTPPGAATNPSPSASVPGR